MMAAHLIGLFISIHDASVDEVAEMLRGGGPTVLARDIVVDLPALRGGVEGAAKHEIGDALLGRPADRLRAEDARRPDRRVRLLQWQLPWVDDAQVIVLALPAERARHG